MWTWAIVFVSLASIALADHMARVRGRSPRIWFWIAFAVGPLAAIALIILGSRNAGQPASAS